MLKVFFDIIHRGNGSVLEVKRLELVARYVHEIFVMPRPQNVILMTLVLLFILIRTLFGTATNSLL